jgi:catechol 2,3-dioxygenase-like lactoylglutathione lyase family enzyme
MATATNKIRGDQAGAAAVDMKLEVVVIPVSDTERAEQFYRRLGVETGRHSARLWRIPIHTARVGVLSSIRQKPHFRRARLGTENLPYRLGHRGRSERARRCRHRGQ